MRRRFATLDVFTNTRFTGNPLAVVLESEGLDTARMQSIAREFNLSETVFVHPPADRDSQSDAGNGQFDAPRLPAREVGGVDVAAMASALGLSVADAGDERWPVERWSAGNPFTCFPVRNLDAMKRCRVDLSRFDDAFRSSGKSAAFVFCRETVDRRNHVHARMFAPAMGMLEDPATGSAAAALSGFLAVHGGYGDGEQVIRIEQGIEMGRPSLMELTIRLQGSQLTGAAIGGEAVIVSEGSITA